MARTLHKLSDPAVRAARKPGRHSDGGGLYLNVAPAGTKSWVFMWVRDGRRREMGLGGYPAISLAYARDRAADCRVAVALGRDPIAEKAKEAEPSFGKCADLYIDSIKSEWRNEKHEGQWTMTLRDYCGPIRGKRVSEVGTEDVLKVLQPIWQEKNETASRLRGRIERVLDYARVKGWREGENPARWRGHLRNILPKRQKLARGHMAAMPYDDVPAFIERLRVSDAMAARALEFAILTAARSGEVLGATWAEVDLDKKLWTIPAPRMKTAEPHTVPLSGRAVELLQQLHENQRGSYVFPSTDARKPLSNMAMAMLLRRMKVEGVTVHGFRSAFRGWCGDQTSFPREIAEAALAHKVGNEVERAYRRSNALERRRELMEAWANYCAGIGGGKVVRMERRGKA